MVNRAPVAAAGARAAEFNLKVKTHEHLPPAL